MHWLKKINIWVPQYEYTSSNQHGERYKKIRHKSIPVARLSSEINGDTVFDLQTLILLGAHVHYPVQYDFEKPHTAYIDIVSAERLREII